MKDFNMQCGFFLGLRLWKDKAGSALIEFAVALPVLLIAIVGLIEVTRYILFREKLESAAVQMIDIVNQGVVVDAASLNTIYATADALLVPFTNANPQVTISMVERPQSSGRSCVGWQYGTAQSAIGSKGGNATLPGFSLPENNQVMVIEMRARYIPVLDTSWTRSWFNGASNGLYVRSYAHTRLTAFRVDPATGQYINNVCA